jgi:voltage-gated potassium channel
MTGEPMDSSHVVQEATPEAALDRFSARIDPWMTVLSIAWLPVLIIPLVRTQHGAVAVTFDALDYFVWAAFGVEYGAKLWLASDRWHFVRHHLLDLAVVAIPVIRPLRLARLLRFVRLGRIVSVLSTGLRRTRAILAHHGLQFVLLAVTIITLGAAALELTFERHSTGPTAIHNFGDAIWWAAVTVTTVGYGDKVPLTGAGRYVAVALMLTGIGLVGFLTATIASFFVQDQHREELSIMKEQLHAIHELLVVTPAKSLHPDGSNRPSEPTQPFSLDGPRSRPEGMGS